MNYHCTTKKEIRAALELEQIKSVTFESWVGVNGGEGEPRSIVIHTRHGSIVISPTAYHTLRIEQA